LPALKFKSLGLLFILDIDSSQHTLLVLLWSEKLLTSKLVFLFLFMIYL